MAPRTHESAEDYLEALYLLSQRTAVRSADLAREMAFSRPSVSVAVKKLRTAGYLSVDEEGVLHLTPGGEAIARDMSERHAFLAEMLVSMGVTPHVAREDACRIEHVISRESFDRLREALEKSREGVL